MIAQEPQSNQNHAVWGLSGTMICSFLISVFVWLS